MSDVNSYRSVQGQSSDDAADTYARPKGRAVLSFVASLIGLAAWFAGIFASTYIVGALMEPVEPETRCFTTATAETDYCRDQFVWEAE